MGIPGPFNQFVGMQMENNFALQNRIPLLRPPMPAPRPLHLGNCMPIPDTLPMTNNGPLPITNEWNDNRGGNKDR